MYRIVIALCLTLGIQHSVRAAYSVSVYVDPVPSCVNNTLYVVVSVSWGDSDTPSSNVLATGYLNSNGIALKPMALNEGSSSITRVYIVTPNDTGVLSVDARGLSANTDLYHTHFDIVNCP